MGRGQDVSGSDTDLLPVKLVALGIFKGGGTVGTDEVGGTVEVGDVVVDDGCHSNLDGFCGLSLPGPARRTKRDSCECTIGLVLLGFLQGVRVGAAVPLGWVSLV